MRAVGLTGLIALVSSLLLLGALVRGEGGHPRGSLEDLRALRERDDLNVLFVLVDTLRADRLSAYGYERETSPTVEALAAGGIRFANHKAQSSWTKTSMASLWTGLYPSHTRVLRYSDALAPDARIAVEVFRDAGYRTVGIWRNGWVASNFGFEQGFDSYHNPRPRPVPANVRKENPSMEVDAGSDEDVIVSALEFLRSYGEERWFLYLHLMDLHEYTYDPETALFGTSYSDIYDNSVRRTDEAIRILLDQLDRRGLRDDTVVVLASDHGEAFGEHRNEGHARDLYGEVTYTPLVIGLPFRLEPGVVLEVPTENVDLWPTILDLIGLPGLGDVDGRSRLPDIERAASGGGPSTDAVPRFAHLDRTWGKTRAAPRPLVSVTQGPFRLIYDALDPDAAELYDLSQDRREQQDVAAMFPDVARDLRAAARVYLEDSQAPWAGGAPQVELDAMHLRQLRALGYAVE